MDDASTYSGRWPVADGEMANRVRTHDWATTAIGSIEGWPPSLRTSIDIMLASPGPVSIIWGPERVQLYNDAYVAIAAERHPTAFGRQVAENWSEAFRETLEPIFQRVFAGETFIVEEQPFLLRTSDGGVEERFFTGSFLPVRDDMGVVAGVFHPLTEVTGKVRADASLRGRDERLHRVLDGMAEGFALIAPDFTILEHNVEAQRLDGRAREEVVGRTTWEAYPGSERSDVGKALKVAMSERRPVSLEHSHAWGDGHQRWLETRVYPAPGGGLAVFSRDVTERKMADAALRERETRYRTLFDIIDEGFCIVEFIDGPHGPMSDYVHLEANPAYVQHSGIRDIVGKTGRSELTAEEAQGWVDLFRRVLETGEPIRFERELGSTGRHLKVACFPVLSGNGRQAAMLFQDVTARRQAEESLRQLNETLEMQVVERTAERDRMWETSPDLMLVIDFDGVFRRVNPAWTKLLGYAPTDLVGHHVNEFVIADDHAATVNAYETAASGAGTAVENRYRHKDGSLRWISWVAAPAGSMTYATGRDVTAEKARAAELRRYREIVDATTSPICAFDKEYRLIAFNRAHQSEFRRVNGFDSCVGDVFPDLFIPEQRPLMRELMSRALAGESFTVTKGFGKPELGTPIWEISYTPLRDGAGQIIGAFHHAKDISERLIAEAELETAQEALRQSQKMEAMGQLTGGVAHDFNNLLSPIIGSLDMLVRKGVGSERERRLIDGALQSAERAKTLVQRLLAFARRQPLQLTPVDIRGLVDGMVALVESTLGPTIDVSVDIAADLPPAKADPNQLEMALLNLAVNARDAMPDGGELIITAKRKSLRENPGSGLPRGHYVCLSVRDTGIGMDELTRQRAVEPFYSTKGVGRGTGLGLSMVHGLAAQFGGELTIKSAPGQGTTIELWLPISTTVPEEGERPLEPLLDVAALGIALLVDDEELVRLSTADMLTDMGYKVVEAGSAEEALALMDDGLEPDLLVTDHLMPGMSGAQLARKVKAQRPTLPVLIVSGYAEAEGVDHTIARLIKPFRNAELVASLRTLMPASSP